MVLPIRTRGARACRVDFVDCWVWEAVIVVVGVDRVAQSITYDRVIIGSEYAIRSNVGLIVDRRVPRVPRVTVAASVAADELGRVEPSIAVIVDVRIVSRSIAIEVTLFVRVERECVVDVQSSVVVVILVGDVAVVIHVVVSRH